MILIYFIAFLPIVLIREFGNNIKEGMIMKIVDSGLFLPYSNNKGPDQPAHLCSLISTFVVSCLGSILPITSIYCNDPKFSDRYACANSADPDQTAPRGAV